MTLERLAFVLGIVAAVATILGISVKDLVQRRQSASLSRSKVGKPPSIPSPETRSGEAVDRPRGEWQGPEKFSCTDPGGIWFKANPWMIRDRCEGWDLLVKLLDAEGEPVFRFVPFRSQGIGQGGMRISDPDKQKRLWHDIAAGSSNRSPKEFSALFRYQNRSDEVRVAEGDLLI